MRLAGALKCQGEIPTEYSASATGLGYIMGKGFKIINEDGEVEYIDEHYMNMSLAGKASEIMFPTEYFDYIVFQHSSNPRYPPQSDPAPCMQFYLEEMSKTHNLVFINDKMAVIEVVKNESN